MMVKNSEFDYWYKEEFFSGELSRQAVIMEVLGQKSGYLCDLVESIIADSWSHGEISWGYLKGSK